MDFSPYRKKGISISSGEYKKYISIIKVLGILITAMLTFFLISSVFSEEGTPVTAMFQKTEESVVENQMSGINVWSLLTDGENITEGDKIRVLSGPPSFLIFKNGSKISIGSGGEIFIKSMKETSDGLFFGEMLVDSGPIAFESQGTTEPEKSFIIWVDENHYIKASQGSILIQNGEIHVIKGEGIEAIEQNEKGKITNQKLIGVGQSLIVNTFTVKATEESIKFLPLYAMIVLGNGTIPEEQASTNDTLTPPVIENFEFTGTAIVVSESLQKIEGTVFSNASKVIVSFSNNGTTVEQEVSLEESEEANETPEATINAIKSPSSDPSEKKLLSKKNWSFIASPTYGTLSTGINTYKFFAINQKGERSNASMLVLQYESKDENVFDTKGGELMITSPNQGKSGNIEGNVITITGTAPKNAAKIVVTNKKLQNPYALKQFSAGDATWKYYTADMESGTYGYTIEAYSSSGSLIATKTINITVKSPEEKTPSLTTPSSKKTDIPSSKPTMMQTTTPEKKLNSSTLEATR